MKGMDVMQQAERSQIGGDWLNSGNTAMIPEVLPVRGDVPAEAVSSKLVDACDSGNQGLLKRSGQVLAQPVISINSETDLSQGVVAFTIS